MLRRKPTRIELKLDDLSEWEAAIKEKDKNKVRPQGQPTSEPDTSQNKSKKDIIHERIGFDPRPLPQTPQQPAVYF